VASISSSWARNQSTNGTGIPSTVVRDGSAIGTGYC
jgi:hypothetical protein